MGEIYVTVQGDMWDKIAFNVMGSETFKDVLMKANLKYKDVYIFGANAEIVVPEIVSKPVGTLPPWKRGGFYE